MRDNMDGMQTVFVSRASSRFACCVEMDNFLFKTRENLSPFRKIHIHNDFCYMWTMMGYVCDASWSLSDDGRLMVAMEWGTAGGGDGGGGGQRTKTERMGNIEKTSLYSEKDRAR